MSKHLVPSDWDVTQYPYQTSCNKSPGPAVYEPLTMKWPSFFYQLMSGIVYDSRYILHVITLSYVNCFVYQW